jgi:hypothetical protein
MLSAQEGIQLRAILRNPDHSKYKELLGIYKLSEDSPEIFVVDVRNLLSSQ